MALVFIHRDQTMERELIQEADRFHDVHVRADRFRGIVLAPAFRDLRTPFRGETLPAMRHRGGALTVARDRIVGRDIRRHRRRRPLNRFVIDHFSFF